jgi:glutamine synthetase
MAPKDARYVLNLIQEKNIKMVDFKFTDLPGTPYEFFLYFDA